MFFFTVGSIQAKFDAFRCSLFCIYWREINSLPFDKSWTRHGSYLLEIQHTYQLSENKQSANVKEIRYDRANSTTTLQGKQLTAQDEPYFQAALWHLRAGRNRLFSKFKPWNPEVRFKPHITLSLSHEFSTLSQCILQMSAEQPVVCITLQFLLQICLRPLIGYESKTNRWLKKTR
jgi:hypothetical protein